jgi:CheY-like chemotaxis protein
MQDDPERRKLTQAARVVVETGSRQSGILVIEDDPDLQWRLARTLTVKGNRVVGTSSGDGALALIREWPMDLVLVDQDLPGMDGLEVSRRIRSEFPDIPVVLMTGQSGPDAQMAAKMAGVAATLIKPFRLEKLSELLDSLQLTPAPAPAE